MLEKNQSGSTCIQLRAAEFVKRNFRTNLMKLILALGAVYRLFLSKVLSRVVSSVSNAVHCESQNNETNELIQRIF
jgi:hypothetical protein